MSYSIENRPESSDWTTITDESFKSEKLGIFWHKGKEYKSYRDVQFSEIPYKVGDRVALNSRGSYGSFRSGDEGTVTHICNGMFPGDFYTTFMNDDRSKTATGHYWRFKKI
tara:strand:- start:101 stop:433 length:333 start_codon:yes stop_codon:yes gene_type:complete